MFVERIMKTLFRTITIGVKTITIVERGGAQPPNTDSKDSWGFIPNKQNEGASEWKITKRKYQN